MNLKGPVFTNRACQEFFDEYGYVKINLLNEAQAEALKAGFKQFEKQHEAINIPFISTSHSNDERLITEVDNLILSVTVPEIGKHIRDSKILFSNFLVKRSGDDSATSAHQDTSLVNEEQFISFSIWVALEDINERNGAMRILPGSHKFPNYIRANPNFPWRYNNVVHLIEKDMVTCPTKKGEALVFSHSLIHASHKNLSGMNRLAVVIALYPTEADIFHFHLDNIQATTVKKYKMSKEAFLSYKKGLPPDKGELVAELPFDSTPLTENDYLRLRKKVGIEKTVWKRILNYIGG